MASPSGSRMASRPASEPNQSFWDDSPKGWASRRWVGSSPRITAERCLSLAARSGLGREQTRLKTHGSQNLRSNREEPLKVLARSSQDEHKAPLRSVQPPRARHFAHAN